jgi:hypothetical protein
MAALPRRKVAVNPTMHSSGGDTCVIYLMGHPGVGKLTIGKALQAHGFVVCDNHLINNPIFALCDPATGVSPEAWAAIDAVRNAVLGFLSTKLDGHYVLTNCLYNTVWDRDIFAQVQGMAKKRGSFFIPVFLSISKDENLRRLTQPSRKALQKSIDPDILPTLDDLLRINHPQGLTLDVTHLSAEQAAMHIMAHIRAHSIEKQGVLIER